MRVELTPAYILHQRSYRDTSLIVDMFTRDYGLVSAVAKGAKRPKSAFRNGLQNFTPVLVSWTGRSDLQTLTRIEVEHVFPRLQGNRLVAGFYLNEVILRITPRAEPHEGLYHAYTDALHALPERDIAETLRIFELQLLSESGYELMLETDADTGEPVDPTANYLYIMEHGPVKIEVNTRQRGLVLRGSTLLALARQTLETSEQLKQAQKLLRQALMPLLGSKPLLSRELWQRDTRSVHKQD